MSLAINACLGVLYRPEQEQVLLACRPLGKVLAGYWEFPGGKLEADEDCFMALARELNEEIGITVISTELHKLGEIKHQYPHGLVNLAIILVPKWAGEIQSCEAQDLVWYDVNQQNKWGLKASRATVNSEVITAFLLPTTAAVLELLKQQTGKN